MPDHTISMSFKRTVRAVIAEALQRNEKIKRSVECYKDPVGVLLGAANDIMEALDLRVLEVEDNIPIEYITKNTVATKTLLHRMFATKLAKDAIDEFGFHATIVVVNTKSRLDYNYTDSPDMVRCRAAMPFICRPGLFLGEPRKDTE